MVMETDDRAADRPFVDVAVHEDVCIESSAEPCGIVIFGASGDLTSRKLLPALFSLHRRRLLPDGFYVLGCLSYGDSPGDDEAFRVKCRGVLSGKGDSPVVEDFVRRCFYLPGDYRDPAFFQALALRLRELDEDSATAGRHLFYLAVPPALPPPIISALGAAGLTAGGGGGPAWVRFVFEKPFGRDLASARALNGELRAFLAEDQIYRIDHYLGKETVQNVLMLRFANALFEPVWNREHVDHVQITVAEALGVEPPEAYERLLLDVMLGDQALFVRSDGAEASWALFTDVLRTWEKGARCGACEFHPYPSGSWGPAEADALLAADGRAWRMP